MYIHTVYRPEECVDILEEWLEYHTSLGVEKFFLYDNAGSFGSLPKTKKARHTSTHSGKNKRGWKFKYTVQEAKEKQNKFLVKYPVIYNEWKNIQSDGKYYYDYKESIRHMIGNIERNNIEKKICAFIDVDEFLVKREEFRESRLRFRTFLNYQYFNSIKEIKESVIREDINTQNINTSKCILNLNTLKKLPNKEDCMHFTNYKELPISQSFLNHYNYGGGMGNLDDLRKNTKISYVDKPFI